MMMRIRKRVATEAFQKKSPDRQSESGQILIQQLNRADVGVGEMSYSRAEHCGENRRSRVVLGATDGRCAKVLEGTVVWLSSDSSGDAVGHVGLILEACEHVILGSFTVLQVSILAGCKGWKGGGDPPSVPHYVGMGNLARMVGVIQKNFSDWERGMRYWSTCR